MEKAKKNNIKITFGMGQGEKKIVFLF